MVETEILDRLKRFEIPGRVTLLEGNGELPKIEVTTDWSNAEIYLHGAHVTDFQRKGEPSILFTSQFSRFKPGEAIRGGVPIIFPWFGAREGEPSHGFARISNWELHEAIALPEGGATLRFRLPETGEGATWPAFTAHYVVRVTDSLELELIITNVDTQQFSFENCLHSYFAVGDISAVSIVGLKGATYLDRVDGFAQKTDTAEALRISSEVDRTYLDTASAVEIHDPKSKRKIRIEKEGSQSTVVWSPGLAKSQQIPDFGNEEYKQMVCVESGNVAKNEITLPSGRSSVLKVRISSARL
ncbi:MAG: D-hexose-6-phosphate mutarotase [Verrucomicrobia subdivision 3 bacterium]|nr:D-hexose-6-phosphate mutarotase [Limisphaerales bacterium]